MSAHGRAGDPGRRADGIAGVTQHPPLRDGREVFQDLMARRVNEIILVSSLYDTFILREDGRLSDLILGEFLELNLHHTSGLTHVSSGEEALRLAAEQPDRYNLIVTAVNAGDMDAAELARRARTAVPPTPVILLAYDGGSLNDFMSHRPVSDLERIFLWPGDAHILLAVIKYMEDKWNVEHDTGEAGVPIILFIEDNIRYYSSFLPMMYREVIRHSQSVISEGCNVSDKILRMRARPKILLCTSWEEAMSYFDRYPEEILGVISDIEFPRNGRLDREAGVEFALKVKRTWPDVQVILQSGRPQNAPQARAVGAAFLLKGSPTFMGDLRRIIIQRFYLGDFIFRMPGGKPVDRARDVQELVEKLLTAPEESVRYHADRNHFSRWLKARTEFELAAELRPMRSSDFATNEEMRSVLVDVIETYRRRRRESTISDFAPARFDPTSSFARIGGGSLGGKARALAFMRSLLATHRLDERWTGVRVTVPPCVVLATDVFDAFMEGNDLKSFALASHDDAEIIRRFQEAALPHGVEEDLAAYLGVTGYPLAVRSSSLLEDSQYQPLAGVYRTFMIPNDHADPALRLRQLAAAIKRVYASTYSSYAKSYFSMTPNRLEEEKMAVIVQRVVGARHGTHFYPDMAGVGRSLNFYPTPPMTTEDGMVAVALGLGRTVVEGGASLAFCPRYPDRLIHLPTVQDLLSSGQREFLSLELLGEDICCNPEDEIHEVSLPLEVAESEGTLTPLASVYSPENDRLYDGLGHPGVRVVTLAPILKHKAFPLAEITSQLLELGSWGMNTQVEMEFAVNLSTTHPEPKEFALLQLRPLVPLRSGESPEIIIRDPRDTVCFSSSVLGDGRRNDLHDVIVVDHERFERAGSRQAAHEIARFNAELAAEGISYILIGVGRWGSADPWLGIPVTWEQISGARVIVECGLRDQRVTPSQGSHFFQNLTSFRVGYFTVNPAAGQGHVDWDWLTAQPAVAQGNYARHLRFAEPLVVRMSGRVQEGVVFKPGGESPGLSS